MSNCSIGLRIPNGANVKGAPNGSSKRCRFDAPVYRDGVVSDRNDAVLMHSCTGEDQCTGGDQLSLNCKLICLSPELKGCSPERHLPEDRISSLPDEVILVILSFLTLKEMVKTSILSSRWLNLWVSTPILDFHAPVLLGYQNDNKKRDEFVEWVNHVLRQWHKGQYLKEFRIGYNLNHGHHKDIDRWLEFALARKVEILELNFLIAGCEPLESLINYALPDCFLKFCGGKANLDGNMSRFLHSGLKCLKSLSLKNVSVTGEAINFILLNCPFLERLEVVGSPMLTNLAISDPTLKLKYLQIKYCSQLKVLGISNFNLVSLDTSIGHLNLVDLPMLMELSISGFANNISQTLSHAASGLSQLEALSLDAFQLKELTQLSCLAQLTNLKRLVIKVRAWHDQSLTMLVSLMKSCHRLEEFVLALIWVKPERTNRTMHEVERLSSKSKSLKVFEFKGYYGRVSDVELIIHVVENAPSLEKIIIETYNITKRKYKFPDHNTEQEARSIALKQFEDLRESKCLPPHIDVLIH